jgi:hypothetical protein
VPISCRPAGPAIKQGPAPQSLCPSAAAPQGQQSSKGLPRRACAHQLLPRWASSQARACPAGPVPISCCPAGPAVKQGPAPQGLCPSAAAPLPSIAQATAPALTTSTLLQMESFRWRHWVSECQTRSAGRPVIGRLPGLGSGCLAEMWLPERKAAEAAGTAAACPPCCTRHAPAACLFHLGLLWTAICTPPKAGRGRRPAGLHQGGRTLAQTPQFRCCRPEIVQAAQNSSNWAWCWPLAGYLAGVALHSTINTALGRFQGPEPQLHGPALFSGLARPAAPSSTCRRRAAARCAPPWQQHSTAASDHTPPSMCADAPRDRAGAGVTGRRRLAQRSWLPLAPALGHISKALVIAGRRPPSVAASPTPTPPAAATASKRW